MATTTYYADRLVPSFGARYQYSLSVQLLPRYWSSSALDLTNLPTTTTTTPADPRYQARVRRNELKFSHVTNVMRSAPLFLLRCFPDKWMGMIGYY